MGLFGCHSYTDEDTAYLGEGSGLNNGCDRHDHRRLLRVRRQEGAAVGSAVTGHDHRALHLVDSRVPGHEPAAKVENLLAEMSYATPCFRFKSESWP
jgi:hypothetical protein